MPRQQQGSLRARSRGAADRQRCRLLVTAITTPGSRLDFACAPAGPVVTAVEIRSDVELEDPDELARLLSVTVGEPLTPEAMRSTLRNLQASGVVASSEPRNASPNSMVTISSSSVGRLLLMRAK